MNLALDPPTPKQVQFYKAATKHVGFGGARGGGKSHAVRTKAVLLAFEYPGIRMLIVRRTYPELVNNHINQLRVLLRDVARYNDKDKRQYYSNCQRECPGRHGFEEPDVAFKASHFPP